MAKFRLTVPIDAGSVDRSEGAVKVAVVDARGKTQSQVVKVPRGKTQAEFTFPEPPPAPLRVVVGPDNASDDDLQRLQTINSTITARSIRNQAAFVAPVVKLPSYIWELWPAWCRKFTVTGTVRCPKTDQPIPGATVCMEEVDYFFIWTATQPLGCTTTDQNGNFSFTFTWCCGWRPWFWDTLYRWKLNVDYAAQVYAALPPEVRVRLLPQPGPEPDLDLAERLLKLTPPLTKSFAIANAPVDDATDLRTGAQLLAPTTSKSMRVDASRAESLRKQLTINLPFPNILPIWPWKPWYPWNDCNPDLIFRVTQECEGKVNVIVDEKVEDTHWNVPQNFHVTLNANELACCVPEDPSCANGNCLVLTHACSHDRQTIGGNIGAPPALPAGYATGDVAFAGVIPITGTATCMDEVDYYRFLYTGPGAPTPTPVPLDAMGGFTRTYFTISPFVLKSATFAPTLIDGRYVFKSLKQYEDESPDFPGAVWYVNRDLLMRWLTDATGWTDGLYTLQVEGFTFDAATNQLTLKELFSCETQLSPGQPSTLRVRVDNRLIGPAAHPPAHLCGPNSVHTCTMEPEVHVANVTLIRGGASIPIAPCSLEQVRPGDAIEILFNAYDPDGHLGGFSLVATYGLNQVSNLLLFGTLSPAPAAIDGIAPATQVGPSYGAALMQGATRPTWRGGAMKLRIEGTAVNDAFPLNCCYQLELRASKRILENCLQQHENLSEYSFFLATDTTDLCAELCK